MASAQPVKLARRGKCRLASISLLHFYLTVGTAHVNCRRNCGFAGRTGTLVHGLRRENISRDHNV